MSEKEVDYLTDKNVMYLSNVLQFEKTKKIENRDFYLLKVTDICYDEQAPKKEALENVLSSLKMEGLNFIFLIIGKTEKVDFYYGISKDLAYKESLDFAIKDIGDSILKPSIQGNFRGSKTRSLSPDERNDILKIIGTMPEAGVIEGVPGANKDDEKYQGIDRLINVMYGDSYCFMIVAKPLNINTMLEVQKKLYEFYDMKSYFAKKSIQTSEGRNKGTSESKTEGTSTTEGSSDSTTETKGTSQNNTHTETDSVGQSKSSTEGTSSGGSSNSTSKSGTEGRNTGRSKSDARTEGDSSSKAETLGTSNSTTKSESTTNVSSSGMSTSETTTIEYSNRNLQDFIKFMDDIVFPRLDYGKGKGMFLTSMCVFTKEKTSLQKLKNTVSALYSGETGNKIPLQAFDITENIKSAFYSFQLPTGKYIYDGIEEKYLTHFAMHHIVKKDKTSCLGNWITTNELGMI